MRRVTAITVPFPGAKRPLEEGHKFGWWDLVIINPDNGKAMIPPADIYVLGAWHPLYEQLLMALNPQSKIIVLWTSSICEMDFVPIEQEYLRYLLVNPRIDRIWFGDENLAAIHSDRGFHAVYPFAVDQFNPPKAEKSNIVTLFCPTGPKKNILNQLAAVVIAHHYNEEIAFRTNIAGYNDFFGPNGALGDYTIRYQWLQEDDYRTLISSARLNLAVSIAETYNYQVAEALMCGTPSIISSAIPLPGHTVSNHNSAMEIADQICTFWDQPKAFELREGFLEYSKYNNTVTWATLVNELDNL